MHYLENILCPLLLQNDCVIIPSLGGFVANYVSAKVDVQHGIISPPSKALSFNKSLINNDGLVINFLTKNKNLTYDEAQKIITQEVQQIKNLLKKGKRVEFKNIGFLYLNKVGKIAFEQDRFFNLLLSSYGLRNVEFISEEVETQQVEETGKIIPLTANNTLEEENKTVKEEEKTTTPLYVKIARYAAVAALVPILFYSFWIPLKTDVLKSGVLYVSDLNPFTTKSEIQYTTPENPTKIEIEPIQTDLETETDIQPEEVEVIDTFTEEESEEVVAEIMPPVIKNTDGAYHVIVGCFSDPNNATNLIQSLKQDGFNAYEVDVKGGLHRISAGNAESLSETNNIRQQLNDKNLSSWVLKK